MDDIEWMTAAQLRGSIATGEFTPRDVADRMIERIERLNPALNAYVAFDPDQIRRDADRLTKGQSAGSLHGVPFAIKEATPIDGLPLTGGLLPKRGTLATRTSVLVKRLIAAGGLFLGKTNMPEAGYYGGTDGHLYGPTHNPWKPGFSAGGSSGGSAAAVAAGLATLAEGSDGAGSVRIPAAMCGVVGLKPSIGRVPLSIQPTRFATWAFHGPITRSVEDAALMMNVMTGPDAEDPMSLPHEGIDFVEQTRLPVRGWRMAWSPDLGLTDNRVDHEVLAIARSAAYAFEELGAVVEDATPAWTHMEDTMWRAIWLPGFAAHTDAADWHSERGNVDDDFIDLIDQGRTLTAVDIARAEIQRARVWEAFTGFMQNYDVLVSPTLASATFPLEQFAPSWLAGESLQRRVLGWLLTYPFNMTGTPAITVPAGFTSDGRPVGLQLSTAHLRDDMAITAAANFEMIRPWRAQRPA